MRSRWGTAAAVLVVLAAYVYIGSGRSWSFRRVDWRRTHQQSFTERYYSALTEGFLRGRLDMPYPVDPRWKGVSNAYDFAARERAGLAWEMWDASFYNGKFYLYFSPVPVLLFYLPFRLVSGGSPPDSLAATFFAAWAFLLSVAFVRRALSGRSTLVPFPVWVLVLGLANIAPYALRVVRTYEVAAMAGMAMTATFAFALLRWMDQPSARRAVSVSVWLGLAIATRPNLAVLLILPIVVFRRDRRAAIAALIPLVVISGALGAYNYARFGNPLELGMTYQISYVPMWRVAPCSLCSVPEAIRFVNGVVHYVFWAPHFTSEFPFVAPQKNVMDPAVSFAGGPEDVVGIGALNPLTLLAAFLVLAIPSRRGVGSAMAGAWLVLFGLATCRWFTARYALDFMMLMTAASIVSIEDALSLAPRLRARIAVTVIAMYAITVGFLLGRVG